MPYTHFHNWSVHTHRRRPKGGNHWQAIRRRQRPWRLGAWFVAIGLAIYAGFALIPGLEVPNIVEFQADRQDAKAKREAETLSEVERLTHEEINKRRATNGGSALLWDGSLAKVARAHSTDMTQRDYFSHDTPEGLDPTDRLHQAGLNCRKGYRYGIAENLAVEIASGSPDQIAAMAVHGWMDSLGHRRNLLDRQYATTGIGASYGVWEGRKAVYLTQVFC